MRSVTMHEIDVLRAEWAAIQKRVHACRERNGGVLVGCYACAEAAKEGAARSIQIEQKLQQWWAQGCREVPGAWKVEPRSEVLRADGLACAFCGVRFTVSDALHGAGDGSKTSSDEGARFMHSECFFRVEHARMKARVMQLEAEEKARKDAKPDCACTIFDDGSAFYLSAFAGGGAPKGAYSYVTCIDQGPKGDVTHRHYETQPEEMGLVNDAAYWKRQHDIALRMERNAKLAADELLADLEKVREALQRAHEDNADLRRQIGKLERAPKRVMPQGAREAADALAKTAQAFVASRMDRDPSLGHLQTAIETYQGVAENGHVPDIYDTVGRLDAAKIARLLVDVETGGALTMLLATLRDEVLTSLHRDHPGAVTAREHLRTLGLEQP